jgi:hypothetical protein
MPLYHNIAGQLVEATDFSISRLGPPNLSVPIAAELAQLLLQMSDRRFQAYKAQQRREARARQQREGIVFKTEPA